MIYVDRIVKAPFSKVIITNTPEAAQPEKAAAPEAVDVEPVVEKEPATEGKGRKKK